MNSQIKKLQAMKVNFRNRKLLLNIPKDTPLKLSQAKDPLLNSEDNNSQKKEKDLRRINNVKPFAFQSSQKLNLDHPKDNYVDFLADTIHLIGQQYVSYLNQGKEERFRAAILSTLTTLQARDRKIIIEYGFEYNSQSQAEFDFQREEQKFKEWLGEVHFRIVSTSFDFMINKMLSFTEIKVYCSENLLLNILLFIQKVQTRIKGISLTDFMFFIDETLNDNLQYLMVKYPQAKEMKPNKRLREEVQPINNMENDINDIIQHSNVDFKFNETENYNSEIMRLMNYIIEVMAQEVDIDGQKYSFAEGFFQIMEHIFTSTYIPEAQEKQLKSKGLSLEAYKKQLGQMVESNKQVKEYWEKVSRHSQYKVGTKINPNTELYSDSEIKTGYFEVKSTSILRILTKWIQQLQKKIFQAKQYIQKRSFRFKNSKKTFSKLNSSQKNDLYLEATKQVSKLKQFIKHIRTNAFSLEGQLAMTIKRNKDKINIPKHQYMVGEFSSKLQDAASSSLLSYLNQIIHILLLIPKNIQQRYSHDEQLRKQLQIDLITFKTSDLLRCKFSSHENEILRAYRELKRICDTKDYIKIVRIKDRLQLGTRDILINIKYMDKMLCEIQLAVTDEIDTKQHAFDAFNHYLYELKRSNLGAIMESACIWAHFDQRSRIYKRIKQKQNEQNYIAKMSKRMQHDCNKQHMIDNNLPFVCSICMKFYFSQQGIIKHKKCNQCGKFYHCALCLENKMDEIELKQFLGLYKLLDVFINKFQLWNGGQYPPHGLIIPKRNKTLEIHFFSTVICKEDAYIVRTLYKSQNNTQIVEVIMIVKNNEIKEWKKLQENYIIYEWKQTRDVNNTVKPLSIINAQKQQRKRREEQEKILNEKREKQIKEIKEKWKQKAKLGKNKDGESQVGSRPGSSHSVDSNQTGKSKNQNIQNPNAHHGNNIQSMEPIQQIKISFNESIAEVSTVTEFRVAKNEVNNEDEVKQTSYLVLGPFYKEREIRAEIKKINNNRVIRDLLERKMEVLFLEDMLIDDEMSFITEESEKYANSLTKISEVYLDSNLISKIEFLEKMPSLTVLHLNYNMIKSIKSLSQLSDLYELMLDYNKIRKIKGLKNKKKLLEVHLNHNRIQEIENLDETPKLEVLELADNKIKEIKGLESLKNLKKLNLSYNFISQIAGFQNLLKLEELELSGNRISRIENIDKLICLRKLTLYKNMIKKIQNLQNLKDLKFLDLHRNQIKKIQNLSTLKKIIYLDLSSNNIRVIQGLEKFEAIAELKLSQNQIVELNPLIDSNLNSLKVLDLSFNGIRKLIGELITFLPKLQKFFLNQNPITITKSQSEIHRKLTNELLKRSGFKFCSFNDQKDTNDSSSDFEDDKVKKINKDANKK